MPPIDSINLVRVRFAVTWKLDPMVKRPVMNKNRVNAPMARNVKLATRFDRMVCLPKMRSFLLSNMSLLVKFTLSRNIATAKSGTVMPKT